MIQEAKQVNIDLWEAWIDLQSPGKLDGGTLYVTGDVFTTDDFLQPFFVKRTNKSAGSGELVLEIIPNLISEEGYIAELMYSEDLEDVDRYQRISIYAGNQLLTTLTDIEKLF